MLNMTVKKRFVIALCFAVVGIDFAATIYDLNVKRYILLHLIMDLIIYHYQSQPVLLDGWHHDYIHLQPPRYSWYHHQ